MTDIRNRPKAAGPSARVLLLRWINRVRLTQAEAADHIGISRVKLNQYLNGERGPSLATAIRIEDATGIAMRSWLVVDEPVAARTVPVVHDHAENR